MFYLVITWIAAPLLYLRLMLRAKRNPEHCHILVIQTAKIGDMICSTPIFREIKRNRPDAKLTVLCSPDTAPLLENNPHVNCVISIRTKSLSGLRGKWQFVRILKHHAPNWVICISPNLTFLLAPLWACVPVRASVLPNFFGATYSTAKQFLTNSQKHQQGRLFSDTVYALLGPLGLVIQERKNEVFASAQADGKIDAMYNAMKDTIGIGISSGNKLKSLPIETLCQLVQLILERTDRDVVLIGSKGDEELGTELSRRFKSTRLNFAIGTLSLRELPALIGRLSLFVGVDSGITYMADALDVTVIDIMGPADPEDQRPLGHNARIIPTTLPCAPCSHAFRAPYECAIGTRACVVNVRADDIFEQVDFALKQLS